MSTPAPPPRPGHGGGDGTAAARGTAGAAFAHCPALDRAAVTQCVQLRDENAVLRQSLTALWADIKQVREQQQQQQRQQHTTDCSVTRARPAMDAEHLAEQMGQAGQVELKQVQGVEQKQVMSQQRYERLVHMPAVWFREHVEPVVRNELDHLGEAESCAQGNTPQVGERPKIEGTLNAATGVNNKHSAGAGAGITGAGDDETETETEEDALHPRRLFVGHNTSVESYRNNT